MKPQNPDGMRLPAVLRAVQLTLNFPSLTLQPVNRTERLLDLITYLLNSREPVSWQEIKNHFPDDYALGVEESNQRKFERDKAELISLGIPIDYQGGSDIKKEGYIIRKEKLFLPEIQFTAKESSLLMLAASAVLESDSFPYRDQLESALHKILSIHDQINPAPEKITMNFSQKERDEVLGKRVQEIQDALDRRKTVEIRYHAFSTGSVTRRKVNPYGLIFRRGQWMLVGWDHLRAALRTFVVSRIDESQVNKRRPGTPDYQIPSSFRLKDYQHQQPWQLEFHDPIAVTVRISEHRLPELLPQLTEAEDLGDRSFRLHVRNQAGFLSWVLSQKTDVQVVNPNEIQDQICSLLHGYQS